jgi:hydroxymethylbilane synthase
MGEVLPEKTVVRVGTRTSKLAMWQAEHVASLMTKQHANCAIAVVGINTVGDVDMKPLAQFEAKGVFTKELDVALLNQEIDLAVHCVKDLPTSLPEGLVLASVLVRADVEDSVVMHEKHKGRKLSDLPAGSVIGTSALRRAATLGRLYPGLVTRNIRGNVQTRLAKLDRGEFDAIILAKAGLERLELHERIAEVLDPAQYGYAVGQGALGILCREGDEKTLQLVRFMSDLKTTLACNAERGMLRTLQGGCKVPICVRTTFTPVAENRVSMSVWAAVLSLDGKEMVESRQETVVAFDKAEEKTVELRAQECGEALGRELLAKGANEMLAITRALVEGAILPAAPTVTTQHVEPSSILATEPTIAEVARKGTKRELEEPTGL